jgi:anti-anti-sigma factor
MIQQVKVIQLSGNLNAHNSHELRESVLETLESGTKIVLVDCEKVTFIDSSGLGALVLAFKSFREVGTRMVICSINEQVRILFELTSMDKVFEIFPNQDAFNQVLLSKS